MNNQEMICHLDDANHAARDQGKKLVPIFRALNKRGTSLDVLRKNQDLADSIMKVIDDTSDLKALLQRVEEVA